MATLKPASENFESYALSTSLAAPRYFGPWVVEGVSTFTDFMTHLVTPAYANIAGNDTNKYLALNAGNSGMVMNGSATYTLHSDGNDAFGLKSMALIGSLPGNITITGYLNGVPVASDIVAIGFGTTDTSGSIEYVQTVQGTGTMLFNADWAKIDKISFASSGFSMIGVSFGLDDIVLRGIDIALDAGSDSGSSATDQITNVDTPLLTGTAEASTELDVFIDDATLPYTSLKTNTDGTFKLEGYKFDEGAHTVTVKDANSHVGTITFTIDQTALAPTGLLLDKTFLVGGNNVPNTTSDYTPEITGTAEKNATVTLFDGTTQVGTTTANELGAWTITTDMLDDGAHQLTAKQTDVAGNKSDASAALTVTVQSGRPTTPVLDDASDSGTTEDNVTNDNTPTLNGTARAFADIVLKDDLGNDLGYGKADADGKWSITVGDGFGQGLVPAPFVLEDGDHAIHAEILEYTRGASNEPLAGPAVTLTIDTEAHTPKTPKLDIDSDSGNTGDGITNSASPTIYGRVEKYATVEIRDNGTLLDTVKADDEGTWHYDAKDLDAGDHVFTVTQIDVAGNKSDASGELKLLIDDEAVAPTIAMNQTFVLPGAGKNATTDVTPEFSGEAEAGALVTVFIDGQQAGSVYAYEDGKWSFTTDLLGDGTHTVTAQQEDAAGNISKASETLTIDVALPGAPVLDKLSDTGSSKTDLVTRDTTPTLSGIARPNTDIYIMDGEYVVGTGKTNEDGTWEITADLRNPQFLQNSFSVMNIEPRDIDGKHELRVAFLEEVTRYPDRSSGNVTIQESGSLELVQGAALTLTIDTKAAPVSVALDGGSDSGVKGDGITNVARPVLSGSGAEAFAVIRIYEPNSELVLAETTAKADGSWSVTVGSALKVGVHQLLATQTDIAGNTSMFGEPLPLTIQAAPVIITPPTTVDGVPVTTAPVTTPGGGTGTSIVVPVVTPGRAEDSGDAATADIPLQSQAGQSLLTAKVHTGYGLTANGGIVQGNASSLAELIAAIKATGETNQISDVTHLTNGGTSFLSLLPNDAALLVQTIRLSGSDVNGAGALDLVGNTDTRAAIVLDGTQLAAGTHITLSDIPFAAVFGDVHVTATTANQILTGDLSGQTFVVSTGASSLVLSGGGADTLQFGMGSNSAVSAADGQATASTTLLHGGTEADVATFNGKAADFTIEQHDGYVLVSANATPEQVAKVVNVESLQFSDQTVVVESRAELTTLAGLYETVLGRQADVGGFDFWGTVEQAGNSLGTIAVEMLKSTEAVAHFGALSGDATHDVAILYQAMFSRVADAAGQAFWVEQMSNGATLVEVADQMAHSTEIVGHQLANTAWDFTV